jgi:phage gp36-like protein
MASVYLTVEELLQYSLASASLQRFTREEQLMAIEAASSEFDGYACVRHNVPFTALPMSAKMHVARVAGFVLMGSRGFDPEGRDKLIVDGYKMAIKFFENVASGKAPLSPAGTIDGSGVNAPSDITPNVYSDPARLPLPEGEEGFGSGSTSCGGRWGGDGA